MDLRKTYVIDSATRENDEIQFTLSVAPTGQWQPVKRVITDSDGMAFIYVIEENDEFSYIVFGRSTWGFLLQTIRSEKDPLLQINDDKFILEGLFEEIQALLYNIEGNSNYGEAFVTAVEEAFEEIFEEA